MYKPDKYCTKDANIEAMLITGFPPHDIDIFMWMEQHVGYFNARSGEVPVKGVSVDENGLMLIATPEGVIQGKPGDWVVRDDLGNFYTCKKETFVNRYSRVETNE